MYELSVFQQGGVDVIDSRSVAEAIGKDHRHLIRDIRSYSEIIENSNETNFGLVDFFIPSTYTDAKGEERPCYLLTKKGCDMVANKMTGEKGVLFTAAYVTAFERMRTAIAAPQFALPQDYPSALRALADAEEQRLALAAKIEADAPAVRFANAITSCDTNILVRDLAKILKQNGVDTGEKRLYEQLRSDGYLIKEGSDKNMPTQRAMDLGLFFIKESPRISKDGAVIDRVSKVTPKGQKYFLNRYAAARRRNLPARTSGAEN